MTPRTSSGPDFALGSARTSHFTDGFGTSTILQLPGHYDATVFVAALWRGIFNLWGADIGHFWGTLPKGGGASLPPFARVSGAPEPPRPPQMADFRSLNNFTTLEPSIGYLKAVWLDFLVSFLRSGRPRGPGKALQNVGGEAPHLFDGFPGPTGPARLRKITPSTQLETY